MKTAWQYLVYLKLKYWMYRKTVGPWMRWSLDDETKEQILKNGWANK